MSPTAIPTVQIDTTPCRRRADGAHEPDLARSDHATLVSFGLDGTDHSVVVRLMPCGACGTTLVGLAATSAEDDDPGVLVQVTGAHVAEQ